MSLAFFDRDKTISYIEHVLNLLMESRFGPSFLRYQPAPMQDIFLLPPENFDLKPAGSFSFSNGARYAEQAATRVRNAFSRMCRSVGSITSSKRYGRPMMG